LQDLWEFDEEFDETASTKVESTKSGVLLLDYKNLELGQTEAPFVIVAMAAGDEVSLVFVLEQKMIVWLPVAL
jgi:hypothetical protein